MLLSGASIHPLLVPKGCGIFMVVHLHYLTVVKISGGNVFSSSE
jgi:hypothetical protein